MPRKHGQNRSALEATVTANPALSLEANAAIVQLARTLADQVDDAGPDVSSRVSAAYLSALKDLRRAVATPVASRSSLQRVEGGRTSAAARSWRSA